MGSLPRSVNDRLINKKKNKAGGFPLFMNMNAREQNKP